MSTENTIRTDLDGWVDQWMDHKARTGVNRQGREARREDRSSNVTRKINDRLQE